KERRSSRASPPRRSLLIRPRRLQRKPRCPPSNACQLPAFLRGHGEFRACARCPSLPTTAKVRRLSARLLPTRFPAGGARFGRSILRGWLQPPARPLRNVLAATPPPKGIGGQSNPSSLR